ncbi:hypothetical protein [Streptomyces sp. NPDC001604]|uniref:hypothetical protein n=1 Tax=Streptomyces sp. NPDC001604 TaxID=3364593 RepID=UPI0036C518FB
MGSSDLERITARRSELDALAEELAKRLQEVEAEREELAIAERVLLRLAEQDRADTEAAGAAVPVKAQVAGRAVLLIPHRGEPGDEAALPADYRRILAIVRAAGGPVQVKGVGEELGPSAAPQGPHGSEADWFNSSSTARTAAAYWPSPAVPPPTRPPCKALPARFAHGESPAGRSARTRRQLCRADQLPQDVSHELHQPPLGRAA